MPLKPLGIRQTTAHEENLLEAGVVVEYQHSGKPILAVILGQKKNRWSVLNQRGKELEISGDRLYRFPGKLPADCASNSERIAFLERVVADADSLAKDVDLAEIWETIHEDTDQVTAKEVTELVFSDDAMAKRLAVWRALIDDRVYFKRKKTGFEPRPVHVIEELQHQIAVESEKAAKREALLSTLLARLQGEDVELPETIYGLEQLAVLGSSAVDAKASIELVNNAIEKANLKINGRPESKAFQLLVRAKHFSVHENLSLHRFARQKAFPKDVEAAAISLTEQEEPRAGDDKRIDLRDALTITIDGERTRDIDDAISFERIDEGYRVGVHITDVAALVEPQSLIDREATLRATSTYCPNFRIPMLPEQLSEGALSLQEGADRRVMSFLFSANADFEITGRTICHSWIRVDRRMSYETADILLCEEGDAAAADAELTQYLRNAWEIASIHETERLERGALQFNRRELMPVVEPEGRIVLEDTGDDNSPSRKLVGELMIVANETAADYAAEHSLQFVFRCQDAPEQPLAEVALDVPEGPARDFQRRGMMKPSVTTTEPAPHVGVGLSKYAQVTSPIRRMVDLVNQRQLSAALLGEPAVYDQQKLLEIIATTEASLAEVRQVQRESNRYWLLQYLKQEKVEELSAIILRVDGPRPLAELDILFSIRPVNLIDKGTPLAKRLGEEIHVKIERIHPRDDKLILTEIE